MQRTSGLTLIPDEFWANDEGLAVHYVMSGAVVSPDLYGPEYVGKRWSVRCMTRLQFDGERVCYEADYHDKSSRARSLGIGG